MNKLWPLYTDWSYRQIQHRIEFSSAYLSKKCTLFVTKNSKWADFDQSWLNFKVHYCGVQHFSILGRWQLWLEYDMVGWERVWRSIQHEWIHIWCFCKARAALSKCKVFHSLLSGYCCKSVPYIVISWMPYSFLFIIIQQSENMYSNSAWIVMKSEWTSWLTVSMNLYPRVPWSSSALGRLVVKIWFYQLSP